MTHLLPHCPDCREPLFPGVDHFCEPIDRLESSRGVIYGVLAALVLWLIFFGAWRFVSETTHPAGVRAGPQSDR
jgi:hypothetical protein